MAESLLSRVQRIVSGRAQDVVDGLETSNPTVVMRETIREMDRVTDKMKARHAKVTAAKVQAEWLDAALDDQIADLNGKARYALDQQREDLARTTLARVMGLENQREQHRKVIADSTAELARIDQDIAELDAERAEMKTILDATTAAADVYGSPKNDLGTREQEKLDRRIAKARRSFERVNEFAAAPSAASLQAVAEIDQLRAESELDARLAALKDGKGSKKK